MNHYNVRWQLPILASDEVFRREDCIGVCECIEFQVSKQKLKPQGQYRCGST